MLPSAEHLAADRIAALARTLISVLSITNHEQAIADWLYERFRALSLAGVQRLNATGKEAIQSWAVLS